VQQPSPKKVKAAAAQALAEKKAIADELGLEEHMP
jgi:hypothetical protein